MREKTSLNFLVESLNKADVRVFSRLLPNFIHVCENSKLPPSQRVQTNEENFYSMIKFLQGRPEQTIEALAANFIHQNSDNELGKALNLPQLLEMLLRLGTLHETEKISGTKQKKRRFRQIEPKYSTNRSKEIINGVKTPTTGELLNAGISNIREQRDVDAKDAKILESESVDEIFKRFDKT
jgi:hypothetical protein